MDEINETEFAAIAEQFLDKELKQNDQEDREKEEEAKSGKKGKRSAKKKAKREKNKKPVEPKETKINIQSTEEASIIEDKEEPKAKKKKRTKDQSDDRSTIKEKPKERLSRSKSDNNTNEPEEKVTKRKKKKKADDGNIKDKVSKIKGGGGGGGGDKSNKDEKNTVFEYMKQQNRPYSLINIFDNLHASIKKPQLQRILDALTEEKQLIMKEYNTKIYLANQSLFETISEERMKEIEQEESETKKEIAALKEELQLKQNELKTILTAYTDEELNSRIIQKEKDIKETTVIAEKIKSNAIEPIPTDKMIEAEKKYEINKARYKKIKSNCLDILDQLGEGLDKNRDQLMEEIKIENDDDLLKQYKIDLK